MKRRPPATLFLPFEDAAPSELDPLLADLDRAVDAGFLADLEDVLERAARAVSLEPAPAAP